MPIPEFNEAGWLPEGVFDCTLDEAATRFACFQRSDRRPGLWTRFSEFIQLARRSGIVRAVLLDGSFVGAEPAPNDLDLILVVSADHDFSTELPVAHYNILDQKRVRKRFGLDIVVVKNASENLEWAIAFF